MGGVLVLLGFFDAVFVHYRRSSLWLWRLLNIFVFVCLYNLGRLEAEICGGSSSL